MITASITERTIDTKIQFEYILRICGLATEKQTSVKCKFENNIQKQKKIPTQHFTFQLNIVQNLLAPNRFKYKKKIIVNIWWRQ